MFHKCACHAPCFSKMGTKDPSKESSEQPDCTIVDVESLAHQVQNVNLFNKATEKSLKGLHHTSDQKNHARKNAMLLRVPD